ncbi:CAP domain-containing protein [Streptomyces sp. URMC 126]|uniref:CAP domain-containing protein n=1 Tax=Streptomyces sp. URMC 126 TaxID=3423401 RepID=UPI003F1D503D
MTSEEATASPRAARDPLTSETTEPAGTTVVIRTTGTAEHTGTTEPYDPDEAPTIPIPLAVPPPAGDARTGPGPAPDPARTSGVGRHRSPRGAGRADRRDGPPENAGPPPEKRPEGHPEQRPGERSAAKARREGKARRKGREPGRGSPAKGTAGAAGGGAVRPPKAKAPARTGLLGASAAVAMGAVAMVSGLLPGNPLTVGDSSGGRGGVPGGQVRADAPIEVPPGARPGRPPAAGHTGPTVPVARPGTAVGTAYDRAGARTLVQAVARTAAGHPPAAADTAGTTDSAGTADTAASAASGVTAATSAATSASAAASVAVPGSPATRITVAAHRRDAVRDTPARTERADSATASARLRADHAASRAADHAADHAAEAGARTSADLAADTRGAAARTVVALVNAERAKAGCRPLRADARLTSLAQSMSEDMARRGFFDHTDPDGRSPWDRAARHGVRNLGGENIARGHADAHAVVDAWMRSAGHRRNILNCDYRTLGVGVQRGAGGPWWTQDFGY